jgi:hypothetical protein
MLLPDTWPRQSCSDQTDRRRTFHLCATTRGAKANPDFPDIGNAYVSALGDSFVRGDEISFGDGWVEQLARSQLRRLWLWYRPMCWRSRASMPHA